MKQLRGSEGLFALVAAILLVLQSLANAQALPMGGSMLDAFGNPLCITSADGDDASGGLPADHVCCPLGCAAATPLPEGPLAPVFVAIVFEQATPAVAAEKLLPLPSHDEYDPGSPRGPPSPL